MPTAAAPVDLAAVAAGFGQLLHAAGVPVGPERCARLARAAVLADPVRVEELYWLGRVTMVTGADQIPTFDAVFDQVFKGIVDVADGRGDPAAAPAARPRGGPARPAPPHRRAETGAPPPARPVAPSVAAAEEGTAPDGTDQVPAAASGIERLAGRDLAELTPDELDELHRLMVELRMAPPRRRSRRHRRGPHGRRTDLGATLRRARRRGGDPVDWVRRRPRERPRRLVLIADVSGSMEPYARAYLHLLHGAVRAARAEAFVFATRLTRLTRQLAATDPDVAVARATAAAPDWAGGTRLGAALAAFNDGYGRRGVARGAVVVIVSDGWDRGDPAVVGEQMARLARLAHRIVWVNPRVAAPGYRPLVGGMAAALPHVDTLVSGHSLDAMRLLLAALDDEGHPGTTR